VAQAAFGVAAFGVGQRQRLAGRATLTVPPIAGPAITTLETLSVALADGQKIMVGWVGRDQPKQRLAVLGKGAGAQAGKGGERATIAHVAGGEGFEGGVAEYNVLGHAELDRGDVAPALQCAPTRASVPDIGIAAAAPALA
jgi:hypothetical protein